jgi:hypothetical protein
MPMAWSLLGIWLAEEQGMRPLPSANAVEALVMSNALEAGGTYMNRGLGHRKLAGLANRSFKTMNTHGVYVTQPRRMETVQPLVQLGFVDQAPQRFNLYRLSRVGEEFLRAFDSDRKQILAWATVKAAKIPKLKNLWPSQHLPAAAASLLDRQLRQFGEGAKAARRRTLLDTTPETAFATSPIDDHRPTAHIGPEHWSDLRSGIAFIRLRDAALAVLSGIEQQLGGDQTATIEPSAGVKSVLYELEVLTLAARVMLEEADTSAGQLAHNFARLCTQQPSAVVMELARRDGTVLRELPGGRLGLGPAGGQIGDGEGQDRNQVQQDAPKLVPELPRIANLYSLAEDIKQSRASRA